VDVSDNVRLERANELGFEPGRVFGTAITLSEQRFNFKR
jgi:hypothetical protein